jgi:hypothetical protein
LGSAASAAFSAAVSGASVADSGATAAGDGEVAASSVVGLPPTGPAAWAMTAVPPMASTAGTAITTSFRFQSHMNLWTPLIVGCTTALRCD